MTFKKKETYIAPTTTFDHIVEQERLLTGSIVTEGNDKPEIGTDDDLGGARDAVGFDESSFDFGSWE